MLKEFSRETAMENDREFERLIFFYINEYAPILKALLSDRKLYLVYKELQASKKGIPESSRLFNKDELLPLSVLFLLKRKQLLNNIKFMIPFWYTMPIISGIMAFFANLGKKKKNQEEKKTLDEERVPDSLSELRIIAAREMEKIVPKGRSIDSYLEDLISRWGILINNQARDNLVEDVNSLVRDKLRNKMRTMMRYEKQTEVNEDTLNTITGSIIDASQALQKISGQNDLFLYIKLYLIKLLESGWY